jgi:hypothetical protein
LQLPEQGFGIAQIWCDEVVEVYAESAKHIETLAA